jgi:hypothetical protein
LEGNQQLDELRRMIEAFEEQLRQERIRNETFRNRLNQQEAQIRELQKTTHGILESRIWKTLTRLDQQFERWGKPSAANRVEAVQLCKEHPLDWTGPLSGKIRVNGWAVAPSGIMAVNIRVDEQEPVPAQIGIPRRDVQALFRSHRGSATSGFRSIVNLDGLSSGAHSIRIQAISNQGTSTEQTFSVQVRGAVPASEFMEIPEGPLISVLLSVPNPESKWLRRTVESVVAQKYPHWELCGVLGPYTAMDHRIKAVTDAGVQAALEAAKGDFVAIIEADDELAPDALLEVALALRENPEADLVYSDEDRIEESGAYVDAFHKPEWSADSMSCLHAGHLGVYRTALARQTADSDFTLRIASQATRVIHVPHVLYHGRILETPPVGPLAAEYYMAHAVRQCRTLLEAARA